MAAIPKGLQWKRRGKIKFTSGSLATARRPFRDTDTDDKTWEQNCSPRLAWFTETRLIPVRWLVLNEGRLCVTRWSAGLVWLNASGAFDRWNFVGSTAVVGWRGLSCHCYLSAEESDLFVGACSSISFWKESPLPTPHPSLSLSLCKNQELKNA